MVRIAMAQIDPWVGDVDGNAERSLAAVARAAELGAQVVALPELVVTGYPPEDLVLKPSFVAANREALERVAEATGEVVAVVGFVDAGRHALYNAAAICHRGAVVAVYRKHLLPNYGVFDERRYFDPGRGHTLLDTAYGVIGVSICEDAWSARGPIVTQGDAGAQVVININSSPYHKGRVGERAEMLGERARRAGSAIVYVNAVGGQDELVFDGGSLVVGPGGDVVARFPQFEEVVDVVDVPLGETGPTRHPSVRRIRVDLPGAGEATESRRAPPAPETAEMYAALRLALADYVRKNGFAKVVVGLSGGIDSSLTAAIAADALGGDNVLGVAMASEFTSAASVDDAKTLASNLGIDFMEIPITAAHHAYLDALLAAFGPAEPGLAEENLQARVRGNLLMAISNRYGHLVVATGNKSEMACGYATLYGDMAGGFALLKDVFKSEVYALARYRNEVSSVIPESVLAKPPSAELRPDQRDEDSLPPYAVLDPILEAYIHDDAPAQAIAASGHDPRLVEAVIAMVDRAEYKRRQAPPGPKVTTKAFGRDRRLPITNRWREGSQASFPPELVGERRGETP